ncbi:MAG: VCBS repeat-containing protein [Flagellimonas sp.]
MKLMETISAFTLGVTKIKLLGHFTLMIVLIGCKGTIEKEDTLFASLDSNDTRIEFSNTLTYTNDFNIYKYRNFYNGGGVGIGDVNNDGLMDIYLTANMESNKLYINKGGMVFEDVTEEVGVAGTRSWSTGVAMVDVNSDGWMDIYVCNSGDVKGDNKKNEFFINNGDGTFTDMAEELGLADSGFSTHAAFFDYDKDGDLDVYLLNNSYRAIGSFNLIENERAIRDEQGGDKLYRNDGNVFTDVSASAGIYGSEIGFGLGVSVADLDRDGWMDIYVSNDFFERDYIYMNNGDGTFREELEHQMRSISGASMGSDTGDLDGDGFPEIFVTEMLPEGDERYKTTMTFEDWDKYQLNLRYGYYHQFTRNMLHRNNGLAGKDQLAFSEVGRLAGVEATDWSWSALINDYDNDGYKDLFVANGLAQDILNQDYLKFISNEEIAKMVIRKEGVDYKKLIDIIPVNKIPNYAFAGGKDITFTNVTSSWGLHEPSHSNGAAYGDLDNDGDMDLVVNNVNMPLFLYENQTNTKKNHFLKFDLVGEKLNRNAIGAKVTLKVGDSLFYQELNPMRGFQSSVDRRMNFGLGKIAKVDSVIVEWYYGKKTILKDVPVNQTLQLYESKAQYVEDRPSSGKSPYFKESTALVAMDFVHTENNYADFDTDRLIYHMKSTEGPKVAVADVNGDGLKDIFIGGAKGYPAALMVQTPTGGFARSNTQLFEKDKDSEDLSSAFFDADGDGDMDLYVCSGGNEYSSNSFALVDRLYLNEGNGKFLKSEQVLPSGKPESTSVVEPADYDGDGDIDLFIGVRLKPRLLGVPQNGYILINDGKGGFKDWTKSVAPDLLHMGMITDAKWTDYDQDGDQDLFVVGEWMNIKLFRNTNGILEEVTSQSGLENTEGWWNTIETADVNGDGFDDMIVGNHGWNSRFSASKEKPIRCYINDFDQNGSAEQIVCMYNGEKEYPLVLRHDLVSQLPSLKKKYLKYEAYKGQTIEDMFDPEVLERSEIHMVVQLASVVLINQKDGTFKIKELPKEAQIAPVYAIVAHDFTGDGNQDLLLGGNLYGVKPEVGRYDASYGVFLKGSAKGEFSMVPRSQSNLSLDGEVRDFQLVSLKGETYLMVARNNDVPLFYKPLKSQH